MLSFPSFALFIYQPVFRLLQIITVCEESAFFFTQPIFIPVTNVSCDLKDVQYP